MLVLAPPLRPDYYLTCKFIFNEKENNHINNYIWITKRGKLKVNYIVNQDKVSKTKVYNMNKKLSTISIENDKLVKLINESYKKYPRNYLLEIDDKPITHATFLDWLRKITEENLTEKPVEELKLENEILNNKLTNCESENKLTDAKYNKRRRDIIFKVNNKGVTPKESTLDNYNIIYDDIKEKYI